MGQNTISRILRWKSSEGEEQQVNLPLECIAHQSGNSPRRVIFALHGFGDNARNFSTLAQEFSLPETLWVFLQAPEGLPFPGDGAQWYELFGDPHTQFRSSCEKVREAIASVTESLGLHWSKAILFGFSQGAFVSLFSGLTFPHPLGGIVALSGYLAQTHRLPLPEKQRIEMPIFVAHGLNDQVVLPAQHFETLDILSHLGFKRVTSKTYRGLAHSLASEEIFDIRTFIEGIS